MISIKKKIIEYIHSNQTHCILINWHFAESGDKMNIIFIFINFRLRSNFHLAYKIRYISR